MAFIIAANESVFENSERISDGFHVRARTSPLNPIPDIRAALQEAEGVNADDSKAVASFAWAPTSGQHTGTSAFSSGASATERKRGDETDAQYAHRVFCAIIGMLTYKHEFQTHDRRFHYEEGVFGTFRTFAPDRSRVQIIARRS
jgi:hypothetical protein